MALSPTQERARNFWITYAVGIYSGLAVGIAGTITVLRATGAIR